MKIKKLILIVLITIISLTMGKVYADECSYTDKYSLMQEAAKVKAKYEPFTEYIENNDCTDEDGCLPSAKHYFKIYITNVSENFYIKVTNELTEESIVYTYSDSEEGIITIEDDNATVVKNYSIKIYASDSTKCSSESLANLYLTLPRYNVYSQESYCQENPDEYVCEEYVEFEAMDYEEFFEKISDKVDVFEDTTEETLTPIQKIMNFIKNNIVWLIVGCVVLITAVVAVKTISRKRRAI